MNLTEFNIPNYIIYSNLADNNTRGVIVYVNSKINSVSVDFGQNFKEYIFIQIKQTDINSCLLFGCMYRSPNSTNKNDEDMLELLKTVFNNCRLNTMIVGDFNYPTINWNNWTSSDNSLGSNLFLDILRDNYILQNVDQPTRARNNDTPHILDLVLTNYDYVENIDYKSPLGKSDHALLQIKCNRSISESEYNSDKLNFSKGNYLALKEALKLDWDSIFLSCNNDVDQMWSVFKKIVQEQTEIFIPVINNFNAWKKSTWTRPISKDLCKLIKRKHRLWTRFIETKDAEVYVAYKKLRNKIKKEMKKLVVNEQREIAKCCKQNPKKFWKYIKNKNKSQSSLGDLKHISSAGQELIATSPEDKADALCEYFSSVFINEPSVASVEMLHANTLPSKMEKVIIDETDILNRLSKLNINKSPGPDHLYPRVLFEIRSVIAYPLRKIFEKSLATKILPADWKSANITPVYKKGDKRCVSNYRPISLTCIISKLLESIIRDDILNHFNDNTFFTNKQFGFLKGRGTVLQLLTVLDDWTRLLEEGGQVDVIYTDLAKAFDKIPHKRLLLKLKSYNIDNEIIDWIESFLSERVQRVCVNGKFSGWKSVLSGIPQGSILGPLLFIIYINDLPEVCDKNSDIFLYADDAKIYKHIKSFEDHNILQDNITNVQLWMDKWLMELNVDKCKVVSFGRHINENWNYHLNNNGIDIDLERLDKIKDLGVNFDSLLTFKDHIHEKINKANSMLGLIKRNFIYFTSDTFVLLYKSMVRSHLEYAHSIWNPYKKADIENLEKVQKRATKLVIKIKHLPYKERLRNLNLPTLKFRRIRGDMIEVYKMLSGKYDPNVKIQIPIVTQSITRGNTLKLSNVRSHYDLRKYNFSSRIVNIWNSLPTELVTVISINSFKNGLDKFWKGQDVVFDWEAELTGVGNRSGLLNADNN